MLRTLRNKWSYLVENKKHYSIFLLLIVINLIAVIIGTVVLKLMPENADKGFFECMIGAFTIMINPSGKYQYGESGISKVFSTVVVMLGMICLTGGTIGYVSSVIMSILDKSKKSVRKLGLKDHIVIVNWNNRVPLLICDYVYDDYKNTYIVVITNEDKNETMDKIKTALREKGFSKFKNVIVRNCDVMSEVALDGVSLNYAKSVIIMSPDTKEDEHIAGFMVSKQYMHIYSYLRKEEYFKLREKEGFEPLNIIVEATNEKSYKLINEYRKNDNNSHITSLAVNYKQIMGKVLGIVTLMPSLNTALQQLFSFIGIELYVIEKDDRNKDISIYEEMQLHKSAMPIFDLGDKYRVYIAENEECIFDSFYRERKEKLLRDKSCFTKDNKVIFAKYLPSNLIKDKKIIIIGSNEKLPYILESIACYNKEYKDGNVQAVLLDTKDNKEKISTYYADSKYDSVLLPNENKPIILDNPYELEQYVLSKVENIDSVLFLSEDTNIEELVDENPLVFWSKLNNLRAKDINNKPLRNYVIELREQKHLDIIEVETIDQLMLSDKFLSQLYAQLSINPLRLSIIKDMITYEGDLASMDDNNEFENNCNCFAIKASNMFKKYFSDSKKDKIEFSSKRELILKVMDMTDNEYMPIGVVFPEDSPQAYLFSKCDEEEKGSLDDALLYDMNDVKKDNNNIITITKDDELVVLHFD